MHKEKRKSLLSPNSHKAINKDLKIRLITSNVILMGIMCVLLSLFFYSKYEHSLDHPLLGIFLPILFIFVIFAGMSAYLNLFLAFKASAPIYRLQGVF